MLSVTEESIVSIKNEVDDIIIGVNIETVAEPIDCHLTGCHGVKHEPLKFREVGVGEESSFVHVSTIHGFGPCAHFVCHLSDCPRAAALSNI